MQRYAFETVIAEEHHHQLDLILKVCFTQKIIPDNQRMKVKYLIVYTSKKQKLYILNTDCLHCDNVYEAECYIFNLIAIENLTTMHFQALNRMKTCLRLIISHSRYKYIHLHLKA